MSNPELKNRECITVKQIEKIEELTRIDPHGVKCEVFKTQIGDWSFGFTYRELYTPDSLWLGSFLLRDLRRLLLKLEETPNENS